MNSQQGMVHGVVAAATVLDFAVADLGHFLERGDRVGGEEFTHRVELQADTADLRSAGEAGEEGLRRECGGAAGAQHQGTTIYDHAE